jgi:integrase
MPAGEIVVFSQEDIQLMLEHVKEKSEQFQITFYLLLFTGLRPTDLLNSKVKDLNVKKLTFSYYSPKVDKYQTIAITSELVENIYPLIRNKNPEDKLVEYADLHNIGRAFRQFIKEMGLSNKGYTLRTFRKTFISIAYEKGVDYVTLSRLIGHSNIRTTAKYYTQFSLAKQHEEVNKISFYKNEKATIYNFDGQQVGKTESKTESLLEKASNL